jgi:beta-lactamase superfamily II metal-dependent hydrolase
MRIERALFLATALGLLVGCAVDTEPTDSESDALEDGPDLGQSRAATLTRGSFGFTTLDVGQGDAAVVLAPDGCVALLDAGPTGSGRTIKDYLHSLGVAKIDLAIVSHFHEDHLGGLDEVEQGSDAIPIAKVYDHGGSYSSTAYTQYDTKFKTRRVTATPGSSMSLCNQVAFKVVASDANGQSTSDENARSVVVKISYGALDLLVGGDLPTAGPESSVGSQVGPIEIYKVHHHGSAGASSTAFLNATKPKVSFISASANNSYGHPAPATLTRLSAAGSTVFRTAAPARGHIEVTSADGSSFTVHKNDQTTAYTSTP